MHDCDLSREYELEQERKKREARERMEPSRDNSLPNQPVSGKGKYIIVSFSFEIVHSLSPCCCLAFDTVKQQSNVCL